MPSATLDCNKTHIIKSFTSTKIKGAHLGGQPGGKVREERLHGGVKRRGNGGDDGGSQERSGDHSWEIVVVVGCQVLAVHQQVVDCLQHKTKKKREMDASLVPSMRWNAQRSEASLLGGSK